MIGVLGSYTDITERKRADLALRLQSRALDASVNAILITAPSPTGNLIEYVNPAFKRITGYEPSRGDRPRLPRSCSATTATRKASR